MFGFTNHGGYRGLYSILFSAPSRPSKQPSSRRATVTDRHEPPLSPTDMLFSAQNSSIASQQQVTRKGGNIPGKPPIVSPTLGHIREVLPAPFTLQQPEEQTDNWDDDFEEGISFTKLHGRFYPPSILC